MDANKVREYMALIRLCWSFNELCSEIRSYGTEHNFPPQEGKQLCLESLNINKLLQLKHTSKQVDTGMKDRDQSLDCVIEGGDQAPLQGEWHTDAIITTCELQTFEGLCKAKSEPYTFFLCPSEELDEVQNKA
jgi:hypothetical protein